jgi:hypothetical protein
MKRDWELIKAMLLEIESREQGRYFVPEPFAGHDLESVKYHLHLLDHAGLVECQLDEPWDGEPILVGCNLTLLGHDLLDSLRDDDNLQPRPAPRLAELAGAARESLRRIA